MSNLLDGIGANVYAGKVAISGESDEINWTSRLKEQIVLALLLRVGREVVGREVTAQSESSERGEGDILRRN